MRPAALFDLTPLELLALFTRDRDDAGDAEVDRVAELARHNHTVRAPKGIEPSAPDWLMPGVPRGHH